MSYGKQCPACGANLDPGETCDCGGRGTSQTVGQRVDAKASRAAELEADRARFKELIGRVTWQMTARYDSGLTVIEAVVDGEPVFRYNASYDYRHGVWRLRPAKVLNFRYRALHLARQVWIEDVKDVRDKHPI